MIVFILMIVLFPALIKIAGRLKIKAGRIRRDLGAGYRSHEHGIGGNRRRSQNRAFEKIHGQIVMAVFTTARFAKRLKKFPPEVHGKFEKSLADIVNAFGDVRRHRGRGLRKLEARAYEIHAHLQWRIILIQDAKNVHTFDIMNHDEVRAWLQGR